MEQAILALLGITITLMLYLDRSRRANDTQFRKEMNEGFAQLRDEIRKGVLAVRAGISAGLEGRDEGAQSANDTLRQP